MINRVFPGLRSATANSAFIAATALFLNGASASPTAEMEVFKTSTCGCCKEWVSYLQSAGYKVTSNDLSQDAMTLKKDFLKIPQSGRSCHTARVGKYVIEGHVPHQAIKKLLKEKPDVVGLSVPNMPMNSPGMGPHSPGSLKVLLIKKDGTLKDWGMF